MVKRLLGITVGWAILMIGTQPILAQDTESETGQLEEIVVTAQKRQESAQKTPISMNLYSADDLVEKGITDMQSLAAQDTSLVFNRNGGQAVLALRGVSTSNTTELGNPSVPIAVDNFVSNRAVALDSVLFDVERIEVLRGPQGTLWGRASTGGMVNIITRKPQKDFEASANLEFGNYNAINAGGALNVPVSDRVQFRAALSSRRHDGYRVNTFQYPGQVPDRGDDEDSQAGRVSLALQLTDNFRGLLSYEMMKMGGVGTVNQTVLFVPDPSGNGDILHTRPNLGDAKAFNIYGMPFQRITDKVAKWEFTLDSLPGGLTLTYLGGYDRYEWHHATSSFSFFDFAGQGFLPIRPFFQNEAPKTQNHELRLTSDTSGRLVWTAGLYYFKEKNDLVSAGIQNPGTANAQPLLEFMYHVDTQSKAGYAQGSYGITDTQKITAGVRYSKDEVSRAGTFALPIFGIPPGPNGIGSYESTKVTWHVGYDWSPTPTNLVYAKVDTGYKPGGFESCAKFKPENVTSGEIGSKNRFNGERVELNAAAFYNDYKDQQVTQFSSTCPTGSVTTNAGRAKIYGLEADFKALVEQVGTFDLGLTYLHANYSQFQAPPPNGNASLIACSSTVPVFDSSGAQVGTNCDLRGNSLPNSPKVTVAGGFEHNWGIGSGDLNFRIEARYTAKQYFDPFNYGDSEQPAYTLTNAYLNYKHDNWKVGLFGRNLGDKDYLTFGAEQTTGGAHQYNYSYGSPRTYGVRFEIAMK